MLLIHLWIVPRSISCQTSTWVMVSSWTALGVFGSRRMRWSMFVQRCSMGFRSGGRASQSIVSMPSSPKNRWHMRLGIVVYQHYPHRISAGGNLLFMMCVSLTLTGPISAWRRGEAFSAILVKPLSVCVTVLCMGQCKLRHLKVCGLLKMTCYFHTNWISYILNWDVRCLCRRWRQFHVFLFWASSSNCTPT